MILAGILICAGLGIMVLILQVICKPGAYYDYYKALDKCVNCKHFDYGDLKYRLIYCRIKGEVIPEEAMECKQMKTKGK